MFMIERARPKPNNSPKDIEAAKEMCIFAGDMFDL